MTKEAMSGKERNMLRAAHLHWVDNKTHAEIAKDLGLSEGTVRNYFSDPEMQQFREFFSWEARQEMRMKIKEKAEQNTKLANNLIAQAVQDQDAKPSDKIRAAKEAQQLPNRYIEMMQRLGLIDTDADETPKSGSTNESDLMARFQQAYEELEEEEVEAE